MSPSEILRCAQDLSRAFVQKPDSYRLGDFLGITCKRVLPNQLGQFEIPSHVTYSDCNDDIHKRMRKHDNSEETLHQSHSNQIKMRIGHEPC